jgi:CPA2 family monovalent cation:H+ antiporter-2
VGSSALITAVTEVVSMLCIGFFVGYLLGWTTLESIFLGGMLAMSSTTIIIKAFGDLNLRNQKFTNIVFGTLVVEDIVGILMMVMLSTVAVSQNVAGGELISSLLKLGFFLVLCFVIGIYVLPTFFRKFRRGMNDETLLVISIGLCFGLVVLATQFGFSIALGAFLMGSILSETIEGAHIEHLTKNIKDLFGAVFFVSVGMMVNPNTLLQYWFPILILTLATILGKSLFSSLGVLLSGQSLKVSLQSGFSLAQIGEFAFIIATLGYSLGVMREFIYPIIVTISVITTFTTPYFIRLANPFYEWLNPKLPVKVKTFLDNYSSGGNIVKDENEWNKLMKYIFTNILVYSVLLIAVLLFFIHFICPFITDKLSGHLPYLLICIINSLLTIVAMIPFLTGLIFMNRKNKEIASQLMSGNNKARRRMTVITLFRMALATFFVMVVLFINFKITAWAIVLISLAIIVFLFSAHRNFKANWIMEDRFMSNLNQKAELERQKNPLCTLINTQLANRDIQLAKMDVSPDSPFIGKKLKELDLRKKYSVNVVKIIRGHKEIYLPTGNDFIYPSDQLTVIGTEEQISFFTQIMEIQDTEEFQTNDEHQIELLSFVVKEDSLILGKNLTQIGFRDFGCTIIEVDRGKEIYVNPDVSFIFEANDLIWIAGEKEKIRQAL